MTIGTSFEYKDRCRDVNKSLSVFLTKIYYRTHHNSTSSPLIFNHVRSDVRNLDCTYGTSPSSSINKVETVKKTNPVKLISNF